METDRLILTEDQARIITHFNQDTGRSWWEIELLQQVELPDQRGTEWKVLRRIIDLQEENQKSINPPG